jgi:5'/3'-nucleotidase SurE
LNVRTRTVTIAAVFTLALTGWSASGGTTASADQAPETAQTSANAEPAKHQRLKILLTNDDGWDKPGIVAAYEALTAAGHDVTLVAPKTNQSGMSAAMPEVEMHVEQPTADPKVFNVDSSPANTMDVGVLAILDEKPDLVVSGINSGANTGGFIGLSGTVGATVAARAIYGIPGIAISLEQSSSDRADYLDAAQLLVDIVNHGTGFIEDGTVLNVNYPELDASRDAPTDVVYAEPSDAVPYDWDYTLRADGGLDFTYSVPEPPTTGDMAELAKDKVTLTLIRTTAGGLGVPAREAREVRLLAAGLD